MPIRKKHEEVEKSSFTLECCDAFSCTLESEWTVSLPSSCLVKTSNGQIYLFKAKLIRFSLIVDFAQRGECDTSENYQNQPALRSVSDQVSGTSVFAQLFSFLHSYATFVVLCALPAKKYREKWNDNGTKNYKYLTK